MLHHSLTHIHPMSRLQLTLMCSPSSSLASSDSNHTRHRDLRASSLSLSSESLPQLSCHPTVRIRSHVPLPSLDFWCLHESKKRASAADVIPRFAADFVAHFLSIKVITGTSINYSSSRRRSSSSSYAWREGSSGRREEGYRKQEETMGAAAEPQTRHTASVTRGETVSAVV